VPGAAHAHTLTIFSLSLQSPSITLVLTSPSPSPIARQMYNATVPPDLVGAGGDVEHLRETLTRWMPEAAIQRWRRRKTECADQDSPGESRAIGPAHHTRCQGVRGSLGAYKGPISLRAGELFWMTDRTPHQSMPVREGTQRQFFRLVTGKVDAWFAAHSTPNPLGTLPDAEIIHHDKFTGRTPAPVPAQADAMDTTVAHAEQLLQALDVS
jgi:hypothetical protein